MPDSGPFTLHVEVNDLDALFDTHRGPAFPHTRRVVDARLAEYLDKLVRERRRIRDVELEVTLREAPGSPSEEDTARRDLQAFFLAERQLAELELRVNQREGWGFLRRTFPLLIAALAVAGLLYVYEPIGTAGTIGDLVTALFYLLFITIVWVLLWDPIEKLLFDAYLLRSHIRALACLQDAKVRFVPQPASTNP